MSALVVAEGVRKSFGRQEVLKGIDLEVQRGEVLCLIGPSGSGKSTLLRCINHLETIDAGHIWVGADLIGYRVRGQRLHHLNERAARRQRRGIGMVFQRFELFPHMTALDNIMLGPTVVLRRTKSSAKARAMELLDRVGLSERADAYPKQLSGGQQQRVAIARALAMDPELMLFDEPTSGLDPELVGEVLTVMTQLAADGMTMIVVTHELGFARDVGDSMVFMADGIIVESGTPAEMIASSRHERTRSFLSRVRNESSASDRADVER